MLAKRALSLASIYGIISLFPRHLHTENISFRGKKMAKKPTVAFRL